MMRAILLALLLALPAGAEPIKVLTCGDSLTAAGGWQVYLPSDMQVVNCGQYGAASWHAAAPDPLLPQHPTGGTVRAAIVANPDASVIVLWYGTNDVRWAQWGGVGVYNDMRFTHTRTRIGIAQMVADAEAAGLGVVLVVPPPIIAAPVGITLEPSASEYNSSIAYTLRGHLEDLLPPERSALVNLHSRFSARAADGLLECLFTGWNNTTDGIHLGGPPCPDGYNGFSFAAAQIVPAIRHAAHD